MYTMVRHVDQNSVITSNTNIFESIFEKLKKNQFTVFFSIIFILYIILAIIIFNKNPYNLITTYNTFFIIMVLFGSFILLMLYLFTKRRSELYYNTINTDSKNINPPSMFSFIIKIISSFAIFGFIGLFIFYFIYLFKNATSMAKFIIYSINILIIIGFITIGYVYIKPFLKSQMNQNIILKLIIDILTYIPCLVLSIIDYFKEQYNLTTRPVWILFIFQIFLIASSYILPKLLDNIINHDAIVLLKDPKSLREENVIGNFEILNKKDYNVAKNNYTYNYAISCWIYLEAQPQSTNISYSDKAIILSYGGKPNIYYNGNTNEFMISAKIGHEEKIIYKTKKLPYQKWINLVINHQAGYMDIFIDNDLIISVKNILPYMSYDNIVIGKKNGIYGFISDVNYFNKPISKDKIAWMYKSTKI